MTRNKHAKEQKAVNFDSIVLKSFWVEDGWLLNDQQLQLRAKSELQLSKPWTLRTPANLAN